MSLTDEQRYITIHAMQAYGGGFVAALADAFSHADLRNAARIEAAFPDYIREYGPGSEFYEVIAEREA